MTKERFIELYQDWCDNFTQVYWFAKFYGITEVQAERIISIGRKLANKEA